MTPKEMIAEFLKQMRDSHQEDIDAVQLPDGVDEYVLERVQADDSETLMFMLRLGYLMGLQTGYAVGSGGDAQDTPPPFTPGPIEA